MREYFTKSLGSKYHLRPLCESAYMIPLLASWPRGCYALKTESEREKEIIPLFGGCVLCLGKPLFYHILLDKEKLLLEVY